MGLVEESEVDALVDELMNEINALENEE